MSPPRYFTIADVYAFGIPAGGLANPARSVSGVSTSGDTLTVEGHGLALNAALLFRAEVGGSLPAPLAAGVTYFAIPLTDSTFQVATVPNGAPVNLTTVGLNTVVSSQLPFDDWIVWASSIIESYLPAHAVPLNPDEDGKYPAVIVAVGCDLVAYRALAHTGGASSSITQKLSEAKEALTAWAKGQTIRGAAGARQKSTNLSISAPVRGTDPRGWDGRGGSERLP